MLHGSANPVTACLHTRRPLIRVSEQRGSSGATFFTVHHMNVGRDDPAYTANIEVNSSNERMSSFLRCIILSGILHLPDF